MAAWREAYQAFGAKPKRTRNSLEALLRRAPAGRLMKETDMFIHPWDAAIGPAE